MKTALYARVSTADQDPENQLIELRRFAAANGWAHVEEFVDFAVSGGRESRPALDRLMGAARRRRIKRLVVWRLDRFGRNLRHLVTAIDELGACGVEFVSLGENIQTETAAGRLQFHILSCMADFERGRGRERTLLGLQKARLAGKRLGRPRRNPLPAGVLPAMMTVRAAASIWGVSKSTAARRLAKGQVPGGTMGAETAGETGLNL